MEKGARIGNEKLSLLRSGIKAGLIDAPEDGPDPFEVAITRALEAHRGKVVDACEALGIGRRTLCRYIAESPRLRAKLKEIRGRDEEEDEEKGEDETE